MLLKPKGENCSQLSRASMSQYKAEWASMIQYEPLGATFSTLVALRTDSVVLGTHSTFSGIACLAASPLWGQAGKGRTERRCCLDLPCGACIVSTFGKRSFRIVFSIFYLWLSDLFQIHFGACHLLKSLTALNCLQRWILNALGCRPNCLIHLTFGIPWPGFYVPRTLLFQAIQNVMVASLLTFVFWPLPCLPFPLTNWRIITLKGLLMCYFLSGASLDTIWAVRLPWKCSLQSLE